MSGLAELLSVAVDHRYRDAACVGLWVTFEPPGDAEDPEDLQARQRVAQAVCGRCPALGPCGELVETIPRMHRAGTVWAGVAYNRRGRPVPVADADRLSGAVS